VLRQKSFLDGCRVRPPVSAAVLLLLLAVVWQRVQAPLCL
jgi:hypothetical protein